MAGPRQIGRCPQGVICSPKVFSGCVNYTGIGNGDLGIPGWEEADNLSIDFVVDTQGLAISEYIQRNLVNVAALGLRNSDPGPAIEAMAHRLLGLSTENITNTSDLSCLGMAPNAYARPLQDLKLAFSMNPNSSGGFYSYDFGNKLGALPPDYVLVASETIVSQHNSVGGYTTVLSSAGTNGGITLKPDNFPAVAEHKMIFSTPGGLVHLKKSVGISSSNAIEGQDEFEISGLTSIGMHGPKQSDVNRIIASEICGLKNKMARYSEFSFTGCEDMKYPSKGIEAVVTVHDGKICDILQTLKTPGAFEVYDIYCHSDCEEKGAKSSIQEVLDNHKLKICSLESMLRDTIQRLSALEIIVANCCKGQNLGSNQSQSSSFVGSGSSGSSSSGGGGSTSSGGGGSTGNGGGDTGNGGGNDSGNGGEDPGVGDPKDDPGLPQQKKGYQCVPSSNGNYTCEYTGVGTKTLGQCQVYCNKWQCIANKCVKIFEYSGGDIHSSEAGCLKAGCVPADPCKGFAPNISIDYNCNNKEIYIDKHPLDDWDTHSGKITVIADNTAAESWYREYEGSFDAVNRWPNRWVIKIPETTIDKAVIKVQVFLDAGCTSQVFTKTVKCT